jgi:ABC-type uncharacterized transport system substrate-binding protein
MQSVQLKRRDFITLLGGAAAAWPLAAYTQQPVTLPVVGMLRSTRAEGFAHLMEALRAGLSQSGYDVGRNVAIEYRWADDQPDRLPALIAELIRKPVAVIVSNTQAALAAKAATTTVPIVFVTGTDPIRDGRPGGNITGISFLSHGSSGKRLDLLPVNIRTHMCICAKASRPLRSACLSFSQWQRGTPRIE